MSYLDICRAQLGTDEGRKDMMYLDSEGIPTIGIGHNLRDRAISQRAIDVIFEDDFAPAIRDAQTIFGDTFDTLSDARKAVVCNMSFQLGFKRLSQFVETIRHIKSGQFEAAADSMLDSLWAKQAPERAKRLAKAMREG